MTDVKTIIEDIAMLGPNGRIAAVATAMAIVDASITDPGVRTAWSLVVALLIEPSLAEMSAEPSPLDKLRDRLASDRPEGESHDPAPMDKRLSLSTAPDWVKIGKLPTSTVVFDHETVARMHAVLERDAAGWRVVDLGAASGTLVNGKPVHRNEAVQAGDVLRFGDCTLTLVP